MIRRSVFYVGVLFACSLLNAQTAQQRKADMDNVLPAGMKVRMVWARGSASNRTVYAYDSEENVIRELTPTSLIPSGRGFTAYISMDGQSVVLKDATTQSIKVIGFDGNNLRNLTSHGTIVCTWQDPNDRTQYLIASGLPGANASGTWAIGITDTTKRRQISTDVFPKNTSRDGFGSGLSVDGNMIGGFHNDRPGLWPTPSGAFIAAKPSPLGDCLGCNYAMRPTTGTGVYEFGHFHDDHREVCVHSADGTYKQTLRMVCNTSGGEAHQLYWTNHVDYVTATLEDGPNPVLFDLARGRCVALESQRGQNKPNAVLLPKEPVEARIPSLATRIPQVSRTPQKLYSIEGRLISKNHVGSSNAAVRSLRIPNGNQDVGIVVGTGIR